MNRIYKTLGFTALMALCVSCGSSPEQSTEGEGNVNDTPDLYTAEYTVENSGSTTTVAEQTIEVQSDTAGIAVEQLDAEMLEELDQISGYYDAVAKADSTAAAGIESLTDEEIF